MIFVYTHYTMANPNPNSNPNPDLPALVNCQECHTDPLPCPVPSLPYFSPHVIPPVPTCLPLTYPPHLPYPFSSLYLSLAPSPPSKSS